MLTFKIRAKKKKSKAGDYVGKTLMDEDEVQYRLTSYDERLYTYISKYGEDYISTRDININISKNGWKFIN